jgi:hypothetical protein
MSSLPSPGHHLLFDFERGELGDGRTPGPPFELARRRLKDLQGIGHKVERFLAARSHWWKQARKPEFEALAPWARGLNAPPVGHLAGDGIFACGLVIAGQGYRLTNVVLSQQRTALLVKLWQSIDTEAPAAAATVLSVPDDANDPLWLALLRLRPLRDFWDRELRRATVDALLQMLPDAWVLDPARVPEGAVIPRLELAAWSELPRCRKAGRAFAITGIHAQERLAVLDENSSLEAWSDTVTAALDAFHSEPKVLTDLTCIGGTDSPPLVAFYQKSGGRVESLGAMALTTAADGGFLPSRAIAV